MTQSAPDSEALLAALSALRRFDGPPEAFWSSFLERTSQLAGARSAHLFAAPGGAVARVASWPAPDAPARAADAASLALASGHTILHSNLGTNYSDGALVAVRLEAVPGQPPAAAVFAVGEASDAELDGTRVLLRLVADVPAAYEQHRTLAVATGDVVRFSEALDLMVLLNDDERYLQAALTLVSELSSRYRCGRVSLGWLESGYVEVQAMSHVERFERKTSAVQALEAAMEEALDQDEELLWPKVEGADAVVRAHGEYALAHSAGYLLSLPVRVNGEAKGVLTCERTEGAFTAAEVRGLRLVCDQAARRLADLKRHDRWFGARLATWAREKLAWFFGVEHTFAKACGMLVAAALLFVAFGTWTYHVEGASILRTDDVVFLPAPFDGYIDEVKVALGEAVKKDQVLLTLDTQELALEEAAAVAEQARHAREGEKARAAVQLADMKISAALEAQAQARLDKVRHLLANAVVKAPMDGLIVEGDLKKLVGSPVRRGDPLFKVARAEQLFVEVEIDERDVPELKVGLAGEVALVTRPHERFPVRVDQVEPVAVVKEGRNVYLARARPAGAPAAWWRPGMSGLAKLDAGQRNIAWILSHRTVEFLRLWTWW